MKKKILITTGDPNGIGPEIIIKSAVKGFLSDCIVIGSHQVFSFYQNLLNIRFNWNELDKPDSAPVLLDIDPEGKIYPQPGECTPEGGLFSLKCLDTAIEKLKNHISENVVTAPLSKKAVSYHVSGFIGHTEYLAEAFQTNRYSMMLANETFRVILVTTHVSIRELPAFITHENVKTAIINSDNFLKSMKDERGIAVCAFNPHAGENGLLGNEEIEIIAPVIDEMQKQGINVSGPFPADSLFKTVYSRPYGVYVAMYHDQGLGPLKMIGKGKGVNITLGLPIFRISVDHGTAYDIAGKNIADETSLIEAVQIAKSIS